MDSPSDALTFATLGLDDAVLASVLKKGYTVPTPIQAGTIPYLLEGRDVLGQATTGTGKTAAFALPLLSRIDPKDRRTQVLVLTPTRELAIQVAASFAEYGRQVSGLNVQAIYGGASYITQIRELKRGVQVVVGTPGRIMDHMRRGAMDLSTLSCLVLDEADEMLRMGFVDDVRWILEQTPAERQCALFSATMPPPIRRIADEHLKNPAVVKIKEESSVASGIRTRVLFTPHRDKTNALIRVLESEETDGVIVFVKTRETTVRVAEDLQNRGFAAVALNGDIPQKQREHTIDQLKNSRLDVLVATDVAARGLDVQRISHVINYDMPHDSEAWVHRIGRTGRAGRQGEALLFLPYSERRRLQYLERNTGQAITEMQFPTAAAVNERRKAEFKQRLLQAATSKQLPVLRQLIQEVQAESELPLEDLAAAAAVLMNDGRPFLLPEEPARRNRPTDDRDNRFGRDRREERPARFERPMADERPGRPERTPPHSQVRNESPGVASAHHQRPIADRSRDDRPRFSEGTGDDRPRRERRPSDRMEQGMERFRIEVGHDHGVMPGNIVGAIANEAGLESRHIGRIEIMSDHSFVDLPEGMPRDLYRELKEVMVMGRHLRISRMETGGAGQRQFSGGGTNRHVGGGRPAGKPPRRVKPTGGARAARPPHKPTSGKPRPPRAT